MAQRLLTQFWLFEARCHDPCLHPFISHWSLVESSTGRPLIGHYTCHDECWHPRAPNQINFRAYTFVFPGQSKCASGAIHKATFLQTHCILANSLLINCINWVSHTHTQKHRLLVSRCLCYENVTVVTYWSGTVSRRKWQVTGMGVERSWHDTQNPNTSCQASQSTAPVDIWRLL